MTAVSAAQWFRGLETLLKINISNFQKIFQELGILKRLCLIKEEYFLYFSGVISSEMCDKRWNFEANNHVVTKLYIFRVIQTLR